MEYYRTMEESEPLVSCKTTEDSHDIVLNVSIQIREKLPGRIYWEEE